MTLKNDIFCLNYFKDRLKYERLTFSITISDKKSFHFKLKYTASSFFNKKNTMNVRISKYEDTEYVIYYILSKWKKITEKQHTINLFLLL